MFLAVYLAVPFIMLVMQLSMLLLMAVLEVAGTVFGKLFVGRPVHAPELLGLGIGTAFYGAAAWYAWEWTGLDPRYLAAVPVAWALLVFYRFYRTRSIYARALALLTEGKHEWMDLEEALYRASSRKKLDPDFCYTQFRRKDAASSFGSSSVKSARAKLRGQGFA